MPYHWPFLDHAKVISIREYAEWSVETLLRKPLLQQLAERRVFTFEKEKTFISGGLRLMEGSPRFFVIYLSDGHNLKLASRAASLTFAHELGHTFSFDLETMTHMPYSNPSEYSGDEKDGIIECLEELATDFSYIWMSYIEHRDQLEEFLEKHSDDTFVDLR